MKFKLWCWTQRVIYHSKSLVIGLMMMLTVMTKMMMKRRMRKMLMYESHVMWCCQPRVFYHSQSLVTYWPHMLCWISYDWTSSSSSLKLPSSESKKIELFVLFVISTMIFTLIIELSYVFVFIWAFPCRGTSIHICLFWAASLPMLNKSGYILNLSILHFAPF